MSQVRRRIGHLEAPQIDGPLPDPGADLQDPIDDTPAVVDDLAGQFCPVVCRDRSVGVDIEPADVSPTEPPLVSGQLDLPGDLV